MARRTFYSFHYQPDSWRAATVRSIGTVDGNRPAADNDWESVTSGGDAAIKRWIANQMSGRSCTVVLVGANTANRKWINYEIIESWNNGMGVVGIHIHGLLDSLKRQSAKGSNPFDYITHGSRGVNLSSIVKCYDPAGTTSQEKYNWISTYLADAVEEAVAIRRAN